MRHFYSPFEKNRSINREEAQYCGLELRIGAPATARPVYPSHRSFKRCRLFTRVIGANTFPQLAAECCEKAVDPMKNLIVVYYMLIVGLIALPSFGKKKQEEPMATLNFVILRDENGKPIRNAAVVMHPVDGKGRQERGGLELKTDPDGKASYDGVPYGKLRVQVLAPGFQTYGDDYNVTQPNMDITIKLKRPAAQYSIYENHPSENNDQKQEPGKPQ
jgi:Carboxypeptidase regulatory-like domain